MPVLGGSGPAFPQVILDLEADLQLNGLWTQVTQYVYGERVKPQITRGRPDETSQAVASQAAFQLNNRDNRFSGHNPTGLYYPNLGRNTPFRFHVPEGGTYLRLEDDQASYASTPTSSALNLSGDLEARIDLNISDYQASVLANKWSPNPGDWSWAFLLNSDGTLAFWWTTDGSTPSKATSTQPLPWPGGRISLKVTYNHTTGAVAFYYATTIGGTYTQLGKTVTPGATGAIYAGAGPIQVGYKGYFATLAGYSATLPFQAGVSWAPAKYTGLNGKVYEFQLRNGIGGSLVADPIFSSQTPGNTAFADAQSNTWSLAGTCTLTDRKFRYHGEMSALPPRWDYSGKDVYMDVVANGPLRRAGQNTPPLSSAMTRAWSMLTGAFAPVAYWPCEDGNNLLAAKIGLLAPSTQVPTQIASGITGGVPIALGGSAATPTSFAADSSFACSYPIPVPGTQVWTGQITPYTNPAVNPVTGAPANVFRFLLDIPAAGDTNNITLLWFRTRGTVAFVTLDYDTSNGGEIQMEGLDATGAQLFALTKVTGLNGAKCLVELSLETSGSSVIAQCSVLKLGQAVPTVFSTTLASSAVKIATQVVVNPLNAVIQSGIGQIGVQAAHASLYLPGSAASLIGPFNAWAGEAAGLRFARLCAEQGYAARIYGYPSTTVVMGAQSPQNFVALLQECEAADNGMIFEPRTSLSLGYRCSHTLTRQDLGLAGALPLALSYTAADLGGAGYMPMEPTDDDLLTRNDEIVTRGSGSVSGSSFEAIMNSDQFAASAALSTQPPPNGVGVYQNSDTVNVLSDSQLGDQAAWRVHRGTVNELRYPTMPVDLTRSELASLYNALQDLDLGDYQQVTSPPGWLSPDAVKVIIWGLTETLGGKIFNIRFQTQPESPYEVLIAGSGASSDSRADTGGSTLHAAVTSTATSFGVDTNAGHARWTIAAGDFPFDILVAGERMTVTNITGSSGTQTFTVTRSVNGVVKAHNAGDLVYLFQPCYFALV